MTNDTYTVRVTRDDGSTTFKCHRTSLSHATRECDAWIHEGWQAEVMTIGCRLQKLWGEHAAISASWIFAFREEVALEQLVPVPENVLVGKEMGLQEQEAAAEGGRAK